MNQSAGTFTIDTRLQRHFCVFALNFPSSDALISIYTNILHQHLINTGFSASILKQCGNIVHAAQILHQRVVQTFQLTAIKFHYIFNLRELSNVFQVIRGIHSINIFHRHRIYFRQFSRAIICRAFSDIIRYFDDICQYNTINMFLPGTAFCWSRLLQNPRGSCETVGSRVSKSLQRQICWKSWSRGIWQDNQRCSQESLWRYGWGCCVVPTSYSFIIYAFGIAS